VRRGTLLNALLHHAPRLANLPRAGIVHRLDKDTSGLLVVAKTPQAQTALVRQLQSRSVNRLYLALVWGRVHSDGVVDAPIGRHPRHRTKMAVVAAGRAARTHYRVMERLPDTTLLECSLDTGRTHQIRVHLVSLAHPIVGDPKYGRARSQRSPAARFARQALHAWKLGLTHPLSGREMFWEAELAADFDALLASLRREGRGADRG
jgi:23S rRNA pseudouridine1911/1915/1917 synthase